MVTPAALRALEHGVAVFGELSGIDMGMRIDQVHIYEIACSATSRPRADLHIFQKSREHGAAFRADRSGHDHAVRFDAAQFARREIGDDDDFAADQRFWFVELRDPRANLADFRADVTVQLQQLVGAHDAFGGFHLARRAFRLS